ncbi:hypothetical protein HHI36_008602 [Cryptolaemus montrouzieri]|uniref:Uncharacterized protein n=1 Tax=Cryptolaemus montrouzieri TaxID=559131 RepID=A0ABD2MSU5_9CUCU
MSASITRVGEHLPRSHSNLTVGVAEISTRVTASATKLKPTDSISNLSYPEILERLSKAPPPDDASDKTTVVRLIDHISSNSSPHISYCVQLPARNTARPR